MPAAILPSSKPSISKKPGKRSESDAPVPASIEIPGYGTLTAEDAVRLAKKAGILTKSGKLARFYR